MSVGKLGAVYLSALPGNVSRCAKWKCLALRNWCIALLWPLKKKKKKKNCDVVQLLRLTAMLESRKLNTARICDVCAGIVRTMRCFCQGSILRCNNVSCSRCAFTKWWSCCSNWLRNKRINFYSSIETKTSKFAPS